MLSVVARRSVPASEDVREVRAHGRSLDDLLAAWLGECLYVHEVEGFVAERIEFASFVTATAPGGEALRLHAFVHGGEVPPARRPERALRRREARHSGTQRRLRRVVVLEAVAASSLIAGRGPRSRRR